MEHIAILGAGLTGLSVAYHLDNGFEIFEKESKAGGLCRTMERDGFLFDYTGHLLHLRRDYTKNLVQTLLPDRLKLHSRNACIYSQGRYINYPFQANISGLPPEVIKECIIGFVETLQTDSPQEQGSPISFKDWVLSTFGAGIAKYFMFPYNEKLWRTPLEEIAADWVSWSIPKPTLDEFLNGALGITNREFGYNPTFLYPKNGGTVQLPHAFLSHIKEEQLHYNKTAVEIDVERRVIRFDDQSLHRYNTLVSTIPLKHLISILRGAPEHVLRAGEQLRYVSVFNINIGVNRANISDKHWIYFPEPEFIFYRAGFPMNFSETVTPPGCSSMYIEVSALPDEHIPQETLLARVYDGLQRCGVLRKENEILTCDVERIECAYVIHDLNRAQALKTIFSFLEQHNICSTGRYGAWKYDSMEGAILDGKQVADGLKLV